ncbi:hypothetical protein M2171_002464 [Bradyrhizobium japonicum USDA 38]|uniref:hypothetical protein n=1 Tax=Bradyrhizobium japonicum TaxID=375 RepID=UPI000675F154|nr:hypothetical protein [Bradyrhizobium japonicum]MCS3893331.1 hypothetical protein [Bradyrhizobium japonicum USDA 38]MCS3945845.1 hypothetical protein [Bradyrhizobium japonicum]
MIAGHGIEGDALSDPFVKHPRSGTSKSARAQSRQVYLISALLLGLREAGYDLETGDLRQDATTAGIGFDRLLIDLTPD